MIGRLLWFAVLMLPASAASQTVYFGNLHAHTSYSDGSGTPEEAYRMARKADMDFLALTEHNHDAADGKGPRKDGLLIATRPILYSGKPSSLIETANRVTEPGTFVAIYGQEFSTISKGNHANIFDVPTVIRVPNGDFTGLRAWTAANPDSSGGAPLVQFNHPRNAERFPADYGREEFPDAQSWVAALDPVVELIEVLNAPALKDGTGFRAKSSESYYFTYLNLGFHVAPSVGHDNHFRNWGVSTDARVAVLADGLTRQDLLRALKQRHAYATEDKNLRVVFRANGALSGDVVSPPAEGSELDLTVLISDDDEPDATYQIDVFSDHPGGDRARKPVESFTARGNAATPLRLDGVRSTGDGQFILLRITQYGDEAGDAEHEEEDRAWTAPIWFESGAPALAPVAPQLRIAALLPNPAGDDLSNEAVELINRGSVSIDVAGWQMRDLAANVWVLPAGTIIAPGGTATLLRAGQAMSMNNDGDVIELLDPTGKVAQTVRYGSVREDERVSVTM